MLLSNSYPFLSKQNLKVFTFHVQFYQFLPWMFKQHFLSVLSGWNVVGLSIPLWNIHWSPFTIFSPSKLPGHFSILDPASLQLSWCPYDTESHDKDILLNFSVLSIFSFLPRSRILPLVVYNKEHKLSLYSYETLTNAFVSISENMWKPIPCSPCPATSAFFRSPAKLFETVIETESLGHQPALQP